jgi:hypothetical protein
MTHRDYGGSILTRLRMGIYILVYMYVRFAVVTAVTGNECVLGCDAMQSGRQLLMLWRNILSRNNF